MPDCDPPADTPTCVTRHRRNGIDWLVTTTWAEIDGRMEPVGLEVRSPDHRTPITGKVVKSDWQYGAIIADHRRRLIESNDWFARTVDDVEASPQQRAAAKREFQRRVSTLGARRGIALTPDGLEAVAKVYLDAHQRGEPVRAAVAEAFGIAISTASARIGLAREAGLLPPAR